MQDTSANGSSVVDSSGEPAGVGARPDRTLIAILAVLAVLVVVSLVVVFSRGTPTMHDASTPEGVVQRYSAAIIAADEETAERYVTEAAVERCEEIGRGDTSHLRVVLVSSTERNDSADVRVSIVTSYTGGPFGSNEYEYEDRFALVRSGDTWLIDSAPWQLALCA
ncbi:hypothetical protein B0I08_10260 [Glaciihabitans tibetensis]|uniref:Lipoprotein LpqB N-terminal domain-containing protein n=1 Tax=Glaciihabitans tibetensis TaxID=1266600 RepID=A0A2T0VGN3_9MICO|nr:hypothetical protein [Glaciihabitans tibetensis]PRY69388.1 hypothetical protein B0I08_10260 [Glaciihabitans tibetensis]